MRIKVLASALIRTLMLLVTPLSSYGKVVEGVTVTPIQSQVFYPGPIKIRIANDSTQTIRSVYALETTLTDSAQAGESLVVPAKVIRSSELPVGPGANAVISVELGEHQAAGTFSGDLRLKSDIGDLSSTQITVRARGRNSLLIFFGVIICGYVASLLLQWWLAVGSESAILLIRLQRTVVEIQTYQSDIERLLGDHTIQAPNTIYKIEDALREAASILRFSPINEVDSLKSKTRSIFELPPKLRSLDAVIRKTAERGNPKLLKTVVEEIDSVDISNEVRYQDRLAGIMSAPGRAEAAGLKQSRSEVATLNKLRLTLLKALQFFMPVLQLTVPLFVAASLAWLSIYDAHQDFGSYRDYFDLFALSLGITFAGDHLIKSGRALF